MSAVDLYQHSKDAVGCKVMGVSNEDVLPLIGKLSRYEKIGSSFFPVIETEDGSEYYCMGVILPYTQEMYDFLCNLPYKRRWEIVADFSMLNQTIKRKGVEE